MLKRTMRNRSLCTRGCSAAEVKDAIEGLLRGDKVADLPTRLCKSVISTMTQMRKDALLQNEDALAAKMDDILGELKYGPQKYQYDQPESPQWIRSRSLRRTAPDDEVRRLNESGKILMRGARPESVDSPTRQAVTPELKTKRVRENSRARYPKSKQIDAAVDKCVEYEIDSRRIAPKLQRVEEIRKKLNDARAALEVYKEKAKHERIRYEMLEQAAAEDLEERLHVEMLDYGAHGPTSLPLEFSKFSGKVLDMRVRERKSAGIRKYDDARALRKEAVKREKAELQVSSAQFQRSYKLQKQHVLHKQDLRREAFKELWVRKSEKNQRDISQKMSELRKAVERLERDLADAQMAANKELIRIRNNEKLVDIPVASRPASSPRRY